MFCGHCGKNIGDLKVCPYCHPEAQTPSDQVSGSPGQQASQSAVPSNKPVEEDTRTVLYPGMAEEPFVPPRQKPVDPAYRPMRQTPPGQSYPPSADQNGAYRQPPYPQQPPRSGQPRYPQQPPVQQPAAPPEKKQKKSKKGLIIAIVIIVVLLLAGGGVAAFFLTAPARDYDRAMQLKESGDYRAAIEIFSELGDTKDSAAQITDCRYLEAVQLMKDGKLDEAEKAFADLGDYKDSAEQIRQCEYEKANALLDSGDYEGARDAFRALGDYSDAQDKAKECDYNLAAKLVESNPAKAIDALGQLGDYKDRKSLLLDAKYKYCESNQDFNDETVYGYMKELVSENYDGAEKLYRKIYDYRVVDAFWNNDPENSDPDSAMTEIPQKDDKILHFTVEGGTPDDTMLVQYKVTWPNGKTNESGFDEHGMYFSLTLSEAPKGKISVDLYTDKKEKLYSTSVTVV